VSLTSFLDIREVNDRVKILRPNESRQIPMPIQAEPRSNRYMMVGTAFDYLLRFELHRRAPHAVVNPWIAELALDRLCPGVGKAVLDVFAQVPDFDLYLPPEEVGKRAKAIVDNAKTSVGTFLRTTSPTSQQLTNLAGHAIRLAKLDDAFRASRLELDFEQAAAEDVQDLLNMLKLVPFDSLLHDTILHLNPHFSDSSKLIGGADTDLIAGDLLIDFKVTKKPAMNAKDLDQLLGYYLLARRQRQLDPTFPDIRRTAIYYCRHGFLWELDAREWTMHPEFLDIETWFFERANKEFGPFPSAQKTKKARGRSGKAAKK